MQKVDEEINRLVYLLIKEQDREGSWKYCLESSIQTDAYMIILLRTLQIHDEELIKRLSQRIIDHQEENGAWKLFYDEKEGNLSTTIEGYYALLFSGYRRPHDESMKQAKQFILTRGGIPEADMMTKVMLTLTGQFPYPHHFILPVEFLLLPPTFPIQLFDMVGFTRVHLVPFILAADKKFYIKTNRTPDLTDLYARNGSDARMRDEPDSYPSYRSLLQSIHQAIQSLPHLPDQLHKRALHRAEQFIEERIEPDGTLYNYFTSTFIMVFALLSRKYSIHHPLIQRAISGLKSLTCRANQQIHIQNTAATVWNTALITHALQKAGVSSGTHTIRKAGKYLLSRQHIRFGDWTIHNPRTFPGGWGFSGGNTINPDIDDTIAALGAIRKYAKQETVFRHTWKKGLQWVLSMQNDDGGWSAFEKNLDNNFVNWIPLEGAESVLRDPSTPDLTGRTLRFLGEEARMNLHDPRIQRGIQWLLKNQEDNGSWYGRWGVCYIYGTWAAVTGLIAVGVSPEHPAIRKAVDWLIRNQNPDGGWGESCRSDVAKSYIPLGRSTPSQTAWAADTLIGVSRKSHSVIERSIHYLVDSPPIEDWPMSYPTGGGVPGNVYFHYHSYRYIWPLQALSHYREKFWEA